MIERTQNSCNSQHFNKLIEPLKSRLEQYTIKEYTDEELKDSHVLSWQ